jgi:hypothetical protein
MFAAGESGKTSLELFKADPDSLKVELEPLRDDTSNLEMHFSFQVRAACPGYRYNDHVRSHLKVSSGVLNGAALPSAPR